ncbi:unnamed protein product, partial [Prorocentrum cordatum]
EEKDEEKDEMQEEEEEDDEEDEDEDEEEEQQQRHEARGGQPQETAEGRAPCSGAGHRRAIGVFPSGLPAAGVEASWRGLRDGALGRGPKPCSASARCLQQGAVPSPAQPERATGERRGRGHPEPHGHERRARGGLEPASNESNSCLLVLSGPCLPCQRHWDRTPRAGPRPRGRCRREGRSAGACAYVFSNYSCLRRAGGDCQRKQLLPTEQLREELQLWTLGGAASGTR